MKMKRFYTLFCSFTFFILDSYRFNTINSSKINNLVTIQEFSKRQIIFKDKSLSRIKGITSFDSKFKDIYQPYSRLDSLVFSMHHKSAYVTASSDPGLHTTRCCTVLHHSEVMILMHHALFFLTYDIGLEAQMFTQGSRPHFINLELKSAWTAVRMMNETILLQYI